VRHTALDGLLTDAIQYAWPRRADAGEVEPSELESWEGLTGSSLELA
jgi:hypothetical protein